MLETLTNVIFKLDHACLRNRYGSTRPPYPRGGFEKTEDGDSLFGNKFESYEELISVGSTMLHQLHNMATVMNQDIRRPSMIWLMARDHPENDAVLFPTMNYR